MRSALGPSADLRAQSCGTTWRVSAFSAPGWRKKPLLVLTSPSSKDVRKEGSKSDERRRSSNVADDPRLWVSRQSATCAARALLGQSRTIPVWRSTSRRNSESSCSRMVLVAISLCIESFPKGDSGSQFSVLSFPLCLSARCGGCPVFAGIPFYLLGDYVHFLFERRKTLHHLVDAQSHIANGFYLCASLS